MDLEGVIESAPSSKATWEYGQAVVLSQELFRVAVACAADRGSSPHLLVTAALYIPASSSLSPPTQFKDTRQMFYPAVLELSSHAGWQGPRKALISSNSCAACSSSEASWWWAGCRLYEGKSAFFDVESLIHATNSFVCQNLLKTILRH